MFSREVDSVDLSVSTCDFALGGVESRGSHSPCVFSVRTIFWLNGCIVVLSRFERSVGHGHEVSRFLQPLTVGYNNFLNVSLPQAIPTEMPGRVSVRS